VLHLRVRQRPLLSLDRGRAGHQPDTKRHSNE
jgi:hypothetical protein